MTPVRLFTICATVLAAGAAAAQDSRFARADTDRNGVLSRAEVDRGLPGIAPRFNAVDRNRDGNLSPDELRTWSANKKSADRKSEGGFAEHFRRADANSDGALTQASGQGCPARGEVRPHRRERRRQAHPGRAAAIFRLEADRAREDLRIVAASMRAGGSACVRAAVR
jgi:hypothetical protein